jgi:DNA polymerase V
MMTIERVEKGLQFLGAVPAGFPAYASDYIEERISLDEYCIRNKSTTFFFRVEGESMTGAYIPPNALLVVDRSIEPKDGNIVVAKVDGELTVKRLQKNSLRFRLLPHSRSSRYKPIIIGEFTQCEIWGVVTYIITDAKEV